MAQKFDLSFRNVVPKAIWGARTLPNTCNLLATGDNEYIIPAGNTVMAFDNNVHTDRKTTLLESRQHNVLCVTLMSLTADAKYLLTVVKVRDNDDNVVHMLLYKLDHQMHETSFRKPKEMVYKNTSFVVGGGKFEFTCAAFSDDSYYFACGSNVPTVGIVIFDNLRSCVFQTISTDASIRSITFSPLDSTKICATGDSGLIKFWRFTSKSVHVAPVVGLKSGSYDYTCNIWVPPYSEGLVIAGSSTGFLSMIVGCEQKGANVYAFGQAHASAVSSCQASSPLLQSQEAGQEDDQCVRQLLVRGDLILAVSAGNCVTAFEMRRVLHGKGVSTLSPALVPVKYYRLPGVGRLLGIQWCMRDSVTSLSVMVMSTTAVFQADIISEKDVAEVGNPTNAQGGYGSPRASRAVTPAALSPRSAAGNSGLGIAVDTDDPHRNSLPQADDIVDVIDTNKLFRYHSGAVHGLSVAARTNTLVSNSFVDGTVRVWDFNRPTSFKGSWIVEPYKERPQENPFHTDVHPCGHVVAFAIEGEVREYSITDGSLDLYRRMSVKAPFVGPTGTAHLITQPVSLVRYSNGGQYLAVVSGKIAQLFHMTIDDFTGPNGTAQPSRLMVMSDHIAPITDLAFSRDDSMIFTSSSDGSVYSWKFGAQSRDQEFVFKGVPATKLCVTRHTAKTNYIIASFECQAESKLLLAAEVVKTRRRSSLAIRRNSAQGGGSLPGSITQDSLTAAALSQILAGNDAQEHVTDPAVGGGSGKTGQLGKRRPFLAVWQDKLTSSPQVIYVDTPVRSIALGESDGPDKFEFCVMGLADGRVLLSLLPFPVRLVDPVSLGLPATVTPASAAPGSAVAAVADASVKMKHALARSGTARSLRKKHSNMTSALADAASRVVSTIHENSEEPNDADTAVTESTAGFDMLDNATLHSTADVAGVTSSVTSSGRVPAHDTNAAIERAMEEPQHQRWKEVLEESKCKLMRMHVGSVNRVLISQNGMWLFSAGEDAMIYMYATSRRAAECMEMPINPDTQENNFLVVEKHKLKGLVNQLFEAQQAIEASKKDYALKVEKIVESREKMVYELETRMKKEIKHRDEAIVTGRHEYLKLKNSMHSEINAVRKQCNDQIAELELAYEDRLSQEGLYLEKMKQAYDEYVVHAQIDLDELRQRTEQKVVMIESEKQNALKEAEKQKGTVMKYFEYMKLRNDELYQSLEEKQVEERFKLKDELEGTNGLLQKAQASILTGEVQANREINKLKTNIDDREREVLKLRSDLDWANNRIMQLEHGLQQSTAELNSRTELSEKWELKSGEMQQKIIELEKLRKALTTQLHSLRQELGPKEETLLNVSEKLQETEREYEHSMHAIAEKEKLLQQKGESLSLLQKQVRELRTGSARKETMLRRAATLLDEYKFSLQQAYFVSEKRSVTRTSKNASETDGAAGGGGAAGDTGGPSGGDGAAAARKKALSKSSGVSGVGETAEVVEIIAQNEGMKTALKRLTDILVPFLNEENIDAEMMDELEAVRREQERHMNQLHRSVNGLKANLELSQSVADVKVANHRNDNQTLLKEVNALRIEVRNLSLENQRLGAQMEFAQATSQRRRLSMFSQEQAISTPVATQSESLQQQRPQHYYAQQNAESAPSHRSETVAPFSAGNISHPAASAHVGAGTATGAGGGTSYENPDPAATLSNSLASDTGKLTPPYASSMSKSASASALPAARHQAHRGGAAAGVVASLQAQPDLSKTAPLPHTNVVSSADGRSIESNRSAVSAGPLPGSKNEYSTSADEKIAALMEMNAVELKALSSGSRGKERKSSSHTPSHTPSSAAASQRRSAPGTDVSHSLPLDDPYASQSRSIDSSMLRNSRSSRELPRRSGDSSSRQNTSKAAIQLPSVFGSGLHNKK